MPPSPAASSYCCSVSGVLVVEDIARITGTRIGNVYLVLLPGELLLIDTGMPGSAGRILAAIDGLGRDRHELRTIVLTHWHPDHIGNAASLRRSTGARIAIHELDAPVLAGLERPAKGRRAMGVLMRVLGIRPIEPDLILRAGDRIGGLEVVHVPGHTAGSIALRRDDGVVVTGDALLGDRHGRVLDPDPSLSLDPARAAESAAAIRALRPRLLLPGHGQPVRDPEPEPLTA